MLLTAIIIVLREVLEAALLMSLLASVGKHLEVKNAHFLIAISLGGVFAYIYADNISTISEWFEYTGQEWINSIIHLFVFISLAVFVIFLQEKILQTAYLKHIFKVLILLPIILVITREGSEIYIYINSFFQGHRAIFSVVLGSIIGSCIGLSIGALIYYALTACELSMRLTVVKFSLSVVACGVLSQAVALLLQADVLHSYSSVWDSSKYLAEDSAIGQLLYAMVGYEATPAPQQVIVYIAGLMLIISGILIRKYLEKYKK